MLNQLHAPIWFILFFPIKFMLATFHQKYLQWRKQKGSFSRTYSIDEENVSGKVVVITGANSGLGKYTAKEMAMRGAIVVMGCRDMKKGEIARQDIIKYSGSSFVELYELDLSDFVSVRRFAAKILEAHPAVDILINNAAVSLNNRKPQLTSEGWHLTMKTNHLGPFLLTKLLVESVASSSIARIVTISSSFCILSTLDTNDVMMTTEKNMGFVGARPYQNSKLANALFTKSLARRYPSIKTYSVCPGLVQTDIFRHLNKKDISELLAWLGIKLFAIDIEHSFETILLCSLGKSVTSQDSGGYFQYGKRLRGVERIVKDETAENLWSASEDLIRISS